MSPDRDRIGPPRLRCRWKSCKEFVPPATKGAYDLCHLGGTVDGSPFAVSSRTRGDREIRRHLSTEPGERKRRMAEQLRDFSGSHTIGSQSNAGRIYLPEII